MGQLILKREKGRGLFSGGPIICYANNRLLNLLDAGREETYYVDSEIVEFKCFNPGVFSKIYKLRIGADECVRLNIRLNGKVPEVEVLNEESVIAVLEAPQLTNEFVKERVTAIRSQLGVSESVAVQLLRDNGFDADTAISAYKNKAELVPFTPTRSVGNYFGVNDNTRQWVVGSGIIPSFKNAIPHSYDDIVDFELLEDGTSVTKGGLGRAAVGGILFGSTGAIVGGVTGGKKAQQKCTSLMVKITVNDMRSPAEYIKLISAPTDKSGFIYKGAYQNAQQIISILQVICNQRDAQKPSSAPTPSGQEISVADEIRKFKGLLDDGIITEEEFAAKKKQLLGL